MLTNKTLLCTGATGSFGKAFIASLLRDHPEINRLVNLSRDELKQSEMAEDFPMSKYRQLRYFLGDVRDKDRLRRAFEGIDVVVHAAALKQVPAAEYNPFEFIQTNILGAQNVIEASLEQGVKQVIALSTDKAAAPINLYGATKLCSDKLFIAANNIKGKRDIKFSVVRYGNVMGSRGSVIPFFLKRRKSGVLPITDERMTRFSITLEDAVAMVKYAIENTWGGETFVPKIPSYRLIDVAKAIAPHAKLEMVGIRPGEKLHEEMITSVDSMGALELARYFAILPPEPLWSVDAFKQRFQATPCKPGFHYASDSNTEWLSVDEIRSLIKKHVDPDFNVG